MGTEFKDMGKMPPAVDVIRRENGELLLSSPYSPREPARSIPHILHTRAELHPDKALLMQRSIEGNWQPLTYQKAWQRACRIASQLLSRNIGRSNPVVILSPRSFEHFCLAMGAQVAGVPVSPVSAPYSLLSRDHAKLIHIVRLLDPAIIFVDDLKSYRAALLALKREDLLKGVEVVVKSPIQHQDSEGLESVVFSHMQDWISETKLDAAMQSLAGINHSTVARYMFTSGSTGMPKAVIYTQEMMVSSIALHAGLNVPQLEEDAIVPAGARILEWMPWSHTGAGVMRLNGVLAGGGTIYFDTGRPVPGEYDETLRNMREVMPTGLSGAPVGYAMLADALELDDDLNKLVFDNINSLGFGSAAMAPALFDRLQALCVKATGARVGITSSLASTEVIGATTVYWPMEGTGTIGLPIPGVAIKLVPNGSKLELRIKGATVTQGYYKDPVKTTEAFDEEGYFKMGDAVQFIDPEVPEAGLAFDGRVAEEFKLVTGTWVSAGTLRTQVNSAVSPLVRDTIICGLNQSYVTVMMWPNINACCKLLNLDPTLPLDKLTSEICSSAAVVDEIRSRLSWHNQQNSGSSTRVQRFTLLLEPPSLDGHELTEKGYINQRATLERRSVLVEDLYAEDHIPDHVHVVY